MGFFSRMLQSLSRGTRGFRLGLENLLQAMTDGITNLPGKISGRLDRRSRWTGSAGEKIGQWSSGTLGKVAAVSDRGVATWMDWTARVFFNIVLAVPRGVLLFGWWLLDLARFGNFWLLLQGLPAILIGLAATGLLVAAITRKESPALIEYYTKQGNAASTSGIGQEPDLDKARLCFERLHKIHPDRPDFTFALGKVLSQVANREAVIAKQAELEYEKSHDKGDLERKRAATASSAEAAEQANNILRALAPEEATGWAPAHLMVAQGFMERARYARSMDEYRFFHKEAQIHFKHALVGLPDNADAHRELGALYEEQDNIPEAFEHYKKAFQTIKEVGLRLGPICMKRNQVEDGRKALREAAEAFKNQVAANPENIEAVKGLAYCYGTLDDFDSALRVLEQAFQTADKPQIKNLYATMVSDFAASYYDSLQRDKSKDSGKQIGVLLTGLRFNSGNPRLLSQLSEATRAGGELGEKAKKQLEEMLLQPEKYAATPLRLALALTAFSNNEIDAAIFHLEKAYKQDPGSIVVTNNLAYFLMKPKQLSPAVAAVVGSCVAMRKLQVPASKEQLERALTLINGALKAGITDPRVLSDMYETRGQTYAKLGLWKEAIDDLDESLKKGQAEGQRQNRELFLTEAECYDHLNMASMAATCRSEAAKIAAKDQKKAEPATPDKNKPAGK